jgi:DNA topoisomerase-1
MKLVIVESPAKCGKIQGFLGQGYKVIATMGHIRALDESLTAIGLDTDFTLRFAFLKDKARAIAGIKTAAEDASEVILAADDDREGEAIAYSVCVLLGLNPAETKRAVFHEITKKAVTTAVANPRQLDMNRVNAQQARAVLDMMIGFTISPLLWKHVTKGLSAGRCQTPALRLVVDRETEIGTHVAESSWKIGGEWKATALVPFKFDAHLVDELDEEESVMNYLELMRDEPAGTIRSAALGNWLRAPPLPFITSSLQQAASATLHIAPKKAMAAAQKLYEAGHITYMRTDSAVLSEEAAEAARAIIRDRYGDEYCGCAAASAPSKGKATSATAAKAQEAHEAIRPTHLDVEELSDEWTTSERKLYKMIWTRTMQSVMSPVRGEQKTVDFEMNGIPDFLWRASWRRTTFQGWRKLGGEAAAEGDDGAAAGTGAATSQEDSDATAWDQALSIGKGDTVKWVTATAKPQTTSPPKRYNEATLIKALEKSGIGRPSTFASLVGTIMEKAYVEKKDITGEKIVVRTLGLKGPGTWPPTETSTERVQGGEKDRLVPTELGKKVCSFAVNHFADIFDYKFTADMENRLDIIAKGSEEWKQVLRDTWAAYKDRYEALGTGAGEATATATKKTFSGGLVAIIKKTGEPLLLKEAISKSGKPTFYGWPQGITFDEMTEAIAREFILKKAVSAGTGQGGQPRESGQVLGHWNGEAVIKKTGKFGPYVVCGKYTVACPADADIEVATKRLEEKAGIETRVVGQYELRKGEKGAYMFKKTLKTKKFVQIPAGLDIMKLTLKEVEAIYKTGAGETASKAPSKKRQNTSNE